MGCSSVLVTVGGKPSPKCHKMMQKRLVLVNNALKFQDQMTWNTVASMLHINLCKEIECPNGIIVTPCFHGYS